MSDTEYNYPDALNDANKIPKNRKSMLGYYNNNPTNKYKYMRHRDEGIGPTNETKVKLKDIVYNANYINFNSTPVSSNYQYIAAGCPPNNNLDLMNELIFKTKIKYVVMVTGIVEKERVKCYDYFDKPTNKPYKVSSAKIELNDELNEFMEIRNVTLTKDEQTHEYTHFWFTGWPDHGVPKDAKNFLMFMAKVRAYSKKHMKEQSEYNPLLVHCSAGVGRTGTFIILDYILNLLNKKPTVNEVRDLIKELRVQRNLYMVQSKEQYDFIFTVLDDIYNKNKYNYDIMFNEALQFMEVPNLESPLPTPSPTPPVPPRNRNLLTSSQRQQLPPPLPPLPPQQLPPPLPPFLPKKQLTPSSNKTVRLSFENKIHNDPRKIMSEQYVTNNVRHTAEGKLKNAESGTFIVRKGRGGDHIYTISIKDNNKLYHYRILKDNNKFYIEGNTKQQFNNLGDLLEHYKENTLNTKVNTKLITQIISGGSRTKKAGRRSSSGGKTKKAKKHRRHRRSPATKKLGSKKSRKTKKYTRRSRK